jgi:hypothetical protein
VKHSERVKVVATAATTSPPTMSEVDDYLWQVYQRAPVKRDSSGDFTWKDPAAAKRFGLSLPLYVITGMDSDFREQLYHAGHAMDAAGIRWSILSGFRDDYRQTIASGLKAGASNSLRGGKARTGGYGHGQAVDITSADGNASEVWRWIDAHGGKYGLYRPMPDDDPAHVQPRGSWHKLAVSLREARERSAGARRRHEGEPTMRLKAVPAEFKRYNEWVVIDEDNPDFYSFAFSCEQEALAYIAHRLVAPVIDHDGNF